MGNPGLFFPALRLAETLVAAMLVASSMPRRRGFPLRLVAFALILGATVVGTDALGTLALGDAPVKNPLVWGVATNIVFTLAMVVGVSACFAVDVWTVIFCVTAGSLMQNLGESLFDLCAVILDVLGVDIPYGSIRGVAIVCCCAVVYAIAYLTVMSPLRGTSEPRFKEHGILLVYVAVIFVVDLLGRLSTAVQAELPVISMVLRAVHLLVAAFVLFAECQMVLVRQLEVAMAAERELSEQRARHYELIRGSMEAIDARCHDIRHKIVGLMVSDQESTVSKGLLQEVVHAVDVFDAHVRTGNAALDVVLAEKALECGRAGVILSAVADGHALDPVVPADVYVLVGAMIDVGLSVIDDGDRSSDDSPSVSLVVRRAMGMASVHLECLAREGVSVDGGALIGVGARNQISGLQRLAGRYGGEVAVEIVDGVLALDVVLFG